MKESNMKGAKRMRVQVLIENVVYSRNLVAEHGLSLLVQRTGMNDMQNDKLLIDTGQSGGFLRNAKSMGIEIRQIGKAVLSHGHYDHTGGVRALLEENKNVQVYARKGILDKKYAIRRNGEVEEIGFDSGVYDVYKDNFILIEGDTEIEDGIFVITDTDMIYDNEFTTKGFLVEKGGEMIKDSFSDEVFVVVKEKDGINVITGCSHTGILNILETAGRRFAGSKIKSVVGGFHLRGMPEAEILELAQKMKEFEIGRICTCHCTGINEYAVLKSVLKSSLCYLATNYSIVV
ncbi:MAG TPA: MBL fold metallo-hydrolase [Fervidobacterium sp.]|nr:MBL fold metallo-hydrolase [Fervidobacterium sp.]